MIRLSAFDSKIRYYSNQFLKSHFCGRLFELPIQIDKRRLLKPSGKRHSLSEQDFKQRSEKFS